VSSQIFVATLLDTATFQDDHLRVEFARSAVDPPGCKSRGESLNH
jgi:hypothetical protein